MARRRAQQGRSLPESPLLGDGKGLLPFKFKPEEDDDQMTGRAGLPLMVEAFRGYRGDDLVRQHFLVTL